VAPQSTNRFRTPFGNEREKHLQKIVSGSWNTGPKGGLCRERPLMIFCAALNRKQGRGRFPALLCDLGRHVFILGLAKRIK